NPARMNWRRCIMPSAWPAVITQASGCGCCGWRVNLYVRPMPENTFDIASKVDLQEVSNAIQNALKEIHTRFDLKDSKSNIQLEGKEAIILSSVDEYKLKAVNDILQTKLHKRGVPIKALSYGTVEPAAGSTVRQKVTMQQ